MVWIRSTWLNNLDHALADPRPDAPAVVVQRTPPHVVSQGELTYSTLDDMEAVAARLFPAWLPGAEGIPTSAGAALAATRRIAIAHAAATAQYGPFIADLAVGALSGQGPGTRHHTPEVRARGLGRVLAASFGRSRCALLFRIPDNIDAHRAIALVRTAEWLVDHGGVGAWICGAALPNVDWVTEVTATQRMAPQPPTTQPTPAEFEPAQNRAQTPPNLPRRQSASRARSPLGKPHPTSRVEVALEDALAARPWASGRLWNQTVRPGPLVNPVRVDLLWKRERCVVEIDGDDHRSPRKYAEDRHRDVMLQLNGYAVLRFTNAQVFDDIENVLVLLQQFLAGRRRAKKGE
ncbi:DUF559 domain-containing protein [Polymorphospora sp. NPDC051019]|uniref:endonuclease domain-containing protein n=1 Tax=Polymorphospora sp. NPDC051019 TaxID=3155725 RepID=UPI003440A598